MSKQKKNGQRRMTLYHLIGLPNLRSAVREEKLQNEINCFEIEPNRPALCIQFQTQKRDPAWRDAFEKISGSTLHVQNDSAGALIVVQDSRGDTLSAWAISFGQGFHYLDQYYLDQRYGLRFAARVANPNQLVSLSKTTLDERPVIERSSIPSGDSLWGFGFRMAGDFATRIEGKSDLSKYGLGDKTVKLQGADAISLPLPTSAANLVDSLCKIKDIMDMSIEDASLKMLEQLAAVPAGRIREELYNKLHAAIDSPSNSRITITWPHEMNDEYGRSEAYRIAGNRIEDGLPTIERLLEVLHDVDVAALPNVLQRKGITLFDQVDGSPVGPKIPLGRWLSFECEISNKRYFFQSGKWYCLDIEYSEIVNRQVAAIFSRELSSYAFPSWKSGQTEREYNEMVAKEFGGICLDGKLVKGSYYRNYIEACDILLPGGTFVHVKNIESSAPASHLLSQAYVATEAARTDESFRAAIAQRVKEITDDFNRYSVVPSKVIIILAKKGDPFTPSSLFTFTQINMIRFVRDIESSGLAKVYVVPIHKEN